MDYQVSPMESQVSLKVEEEGRRREAEKAMWRPWKQDQAEAILMILKMEEQPTSQGMWTVSRS